MQVIFDHTQVEASNITTFFFKPEKPFSYTAGQFIEFRLPHDHPDSRGQHRWFTLSSSPSQDLLSITTKFTPDKGSTFKQALSGLKRGDAVNFSEPLGDFVLPKFMQTPLVFVAGGIGITPIHSMLQWVADSGEERPIKLLYGVKSEDDIAFQDTFDRAKQHATIVVEEPSEAWGGERGRLNAEMILGLEKPSDDTLIYLSGPEAMMETLIEDILKAGINPRQIVRDTFPGYHTL